MSNQSEVGIFSSLDGWFAVDADGLTYASLREYVRIYAGSLRCRQSDGRRQVILGYDRRFGSERFAALAAAELARAGIAVAIASTPVPTPAVTGALLSTKADGALMIGGSNLPAEYNGVQAWIDDGSRVAPTTIFRHSVNEPDEPDALIPVPVSDPGTVTSTDLLSPYLSRLSHLVNLERLRGAGLTFVVDVMYGSTAGLVSTLFTGDATEGVELNHLRNPIFPGISAPDPVESNLTRLQRIVIDGEAMLGLAVDGSGERLGVVDEQGRFVDDRLVSLLLARTVFETRRAHGALIKSASSTSGLYQLAAGLGAKLVETAPGWPSLSLAMVREHASLAVDGDGGYAIGDHLPDRDGLAAGLLLVDYCLHTQRRLSELIEEVEPIIGGSVYLRRAVPLGNRDLAAMTDRLERLAPPIKISGESFTGGRIFGASGGIHESHWALKLTADGDQWLLLQLDANLGQLLLTVEAETRERAEALVGAGTAFVLGGADSPV